MKPRSARIAFAVLAMGFVAAASLLLQGAPDERMLVVDLGDPREVRALRVTYWRVDDDDVQGGFALTFNSPPERRVRQAVRVTDGEYFVEVTVEKGLPPRAETAAVTRRIAWNGPELTVFAAANAGRRSGPGATEAPAPSGEKPPERPPQIPR